MPSAASGRLTLGERDQELHRQLQVEDRVLVYSEATVAGDYSSVFTGFTALGIGYAVNDPFLGQIAEAMTWDSVATASDIAKLHARAVVLW